MQDHVKSTNDYSLSFLQVLLKEGCATIHMTVRTKQRTCFHSKPTITITITHSQPTSLNISSHSCEVPRKSQIPSSQSLASRRYRYFVSPPA